MNRSFVSGPRFLFVVAVVVLCFSAVFSRLLYLHVLDGEKLSRIVQDNRKSFQVINARRGNIVDSRGELLATTHEVYRVGVDPQSLKPEDFEKIPTLAALLRVPESKVRSAFETRMRTVNSEDGEVLRDIRWAKLADGVARDTLEKVRDLGIKGVYGNPEYKRIYPNTSMAAHVIGFVNLEGTAVTGVETTMDFYLKGQDGWRDGERDGLRRQLSQFNHREVAPRSGLNVELSLDMVIQHYVEEEIEAIVEEYQPGGVTIIVSEPATGYVLALANYPTYNPNVFWKSPVDAHRNRAVTDIYEPGSTFKIVPAAGAMQEGLAYPDEEFDCGEAVALYNGREVKLPSDHHHYDILSLEEIVVKSSNRGAALLGMRLGDERLHDYSQDFGFGERTGLGLPGEVNGILHDPRNWDGLTISRLPMGHAISATPIQVHMAMATVANRGVLMQPQVVRRLFDEKGNTAVSFDPVARRRVISSDTAGTLANMLEMVCRPGGTATEASLPGYQVAGKTGTTQMIIDGRYSRQHHVASFSGFFPASSPKLVITIVVEDAQLPGKAYGGVVAAPSFKRLAYECANYLGIQPVGNLSMTTTEGR